MVEVSSVVVDTISFVVCSCVVIGVVVAVLEQLLLLKLYVSHTVTKSKMFRLKKT